MNEPGHEPDAPRDGSSIKSSGFAAAGSPDHRDTAAADDDAAKGAALLQLCRGFIAKQSISCAEAVYQSDRVILNAYDFIAEICEIAGYQVEAD